MVGDVTFVKPTKQENKGEGYWPLYRDVNGRRWSIADACFTKAGTRKSARKILSRYPNQRFLAVGSGWSTSYALYTYPVIPHLVDATRMHRDRER